MSQEDEMLSVNNRRLEAEVKSLKLSLWDQFFMAAIGGCLHHGAMTGTKMAAEVADNMMAEREARKK